MRRKVFKEATHKDLKNIIPNMSFFGVKKIEKQRFFQPMEHFYI
jgi:hypothetical protein